MLTAPQLPPWVSGSVPQAGVHSAPARTPPHPGLRGLRSSLRMCAHCQFSRAPRAPIFHRANCNTRTLQNPSHTHSPQSPHTPQARVLSHAQHSSAFNMGKLILHSTLGTSQSPTQAPHVRRSWKLGGAPWSLSLQGHPSPFQLARSDFKGGLAAGGPPPGVPPGLDADLEAGGGDPRARPSRGGRGQGACEPRGVPRGPAGGL